MTSSYQRHIDVKPKCHVSQETPVVLKIDLFLFRDGIAAVH